MSKSPGYSKNNALLDSENSETESDTNKPGIFSLSNNQCYQEIRFSFFFFRFLTSFFI